MAGANTSVAFKDLYPSQFNYMLTCISGIADLAIQISGYTDSRMDSIITKCMALLATWKDVKSYATFTGHSAADRSALEQQQAHLDFFFRSLHQYVYAPTLQGIYRNLHDIGVILELLIREINRNE